MIYFKVTMNTAEKILDIIKAIPESIAKEVLDFASYLKAKHEHSNLTNLMNAQESSLKTIWDNPDDEI